MAKRTIAHQYMNIASLSYSSRKLTKILDTSLVLHSKPMALLIYKSAKDEGKGYSHASMVSPPRFYVHGIKSIATQNKEEWHRITHPGDIINQGNFSYVEYTL